METIIKQINDDLPPLTPHYMGLPDFVDLFVGSVMAAREIGPERYGIDFVPCFEREMSLEDAIFDIARSADNAYLLWNKDSKPLIYINTRCLIPFGSPLVNSNTTSVFGCIWNDVACEMCGKQHPLSELLKYNNEPFSVSNLQEQKYIFSGIWKRQIGPKLEANRQKEPSDRRGAPEPM